ncbi:MAG: hypothetical protein J6386_22870 [Candidatus Synoicihabitans palmerolidicus]|nr:hypothetical protein [Candidatus Synoicihabitans palmerolidicus]
MLAAIQLFILNSRELALPDFLFREVESRAKSAGLGIEFGSASFDPSGRILLRNVRLSLSSFDEPILRAESIHLEIDPWSLWMRELKTRSVRISGADLLIPAMLSPSGTTVPLVSNLDPTFRPGSSARHVAIDHLTTQVGPIPLDLHGEFVLPLPSKTEQRPLDQLLKSIARNYVNACRTVSSILPRIPPLEDPYLHVRLIPHEAHSADLELAFSVRRANSPPIPGHSSPAIV